MNPAIFARSHDGAQSRVASSGADKSQVTIGGDGET